MQGGAMQGRTSYRMRQQRLFRIFTLYLGLLAVAGCGGGGGGGEASSPPATTGIVSGSLMVPPHQIREIEPNETLAQAQMLTSTSIVTGFAAVGDPSLPIPSADVEVQDLYRISVPGRVRLLLTIAEDDLALNDVDLFLLDEAGNPLDVSQGRIATEFLETPGAGDFLVGVQAFQGASAYVLSLSSLGILSGPREEIVPAGAAFVPGEVLMALRKPDQTGLRQPVTTLAATYGLAHRQTFPDGATLWQVSLPKQAFRQPGGPHPKALFPQSEENALKALTIDTIRRLRLDSNVAYAEPNFLRQPSRLPNDPLFELQWHYDLIYLPEAWDTTVGSDEVIVAVIDTGVVADHPDLRARLVDGFDFVSDPANANDGDGIDPDPTDPGDDPQGASSTFHGTHVAGTVGAETHNATGIAGVTWQTRIMPLRVLGLQGGTDTDLAQAIRYAAGLPNVSGTIPPERAQVINMSLGGPGFSQTLQDAISAARARGVVVVAAAGNENTSAFQSPASLEGVIAVSAVDANAAKAPYSNFGPSIDVAAPGGNTAVDLNHDTFVDGVLSTLGTDRGIFIFRLYQGTSMASSHVAGVVALMFAVHPALTPMEIDLLLDEAHPGTTVRITRDLGAPGWDPFFGHGLIDAAGAVTAAGMLGGRIEPPPTGSTLAVSTQRLNFENYLRSRSFDLMRTGSGTLNIIEVASDAPWLIVTPTSGTAPLRVTATVDRTGLAPGAHAATITITSDATLGHPVAIVDVEARVGGRTLGDVGPVFVRVLNRETFEAIEEVDTDAAQNYAYTLPPLAPGTYLILAGTDRDHDGTICEIEDACGIFPEAVTITVGQDTAGVDFVVSDLMSPQSLPAAFRHLQGLLFKGLD